MHYAILCYDSEEVVSAWTKEQDDAAIAKLGVVEKKLAEQGRLGPVARLMPTTTATTIRKGKEPIVLDGPFAETKEQLLGFFIVDCGSLEQAIETAKDSGSRQQLRGRVRGTAAAAAAGAGCALSRSRAARTRSAPERPFGGALREARFLQPEHEALRDARVREAGMRRL